jgi:capsular polysaccharide biosynthesis protein
MTQAPLGELPPEDGWAAEDGSNWRHSIVVLASWWKEIAAITAGVALLAGLVAASLNGLSEPTYKAWVDVAIVRTVSQLNFDQRFTTTSDTDIRYIAMNASAWRNALVGLASGPAIAEQVVAQIGDTLDAKHRIPANLAEAVDAVRIGGGASLGDSDLIRITATADTPERAVRIATAWAEAYVNKVNQIYGQAPDELLTSMGAEQARASADYQKTQAALEAFIAGNRTDELSRQVAEKQGVIDQVVKARANVAAAYLDAETQARSARFDRWLQVTRALAQARTLRNQVAAGGSASTGSGALIADLLKLQALTQVLDKPTSSAQAAQSTSTGSTQSTSPGTVQVQVGGTPLQIQLDANATLSREELLADIDALVQALEPLRAELERQIVAPDQDSLEAGMSIYLGEAKTGTEPGSASSLPTTTEGGGLGLLDSTVRRLEEEMRGLRAALETETARYTQLTQARDLAWETLKTVSSKVAELNLARAAAGSEVRIASPAVQPPQPESRVGVAKAVLYGGVAGLLIGVLVALGANSFGISPFFSGRRARA